MKYEYSLEETAESQQVQRNKGIISEIERCIMHCTWGITQGFDLLADHAPRNSHQLVIVHCRDIIISVSQSSHSVLVTLVLH